MPNPQRFEGPVLEDLLVDVRSRFGADVEIIEANKIRSGGIGGFFAKETFEVVVAIDDTLSVSVTSDSPNYAGARRRAREDGIPAVATSLLDLVDAVDDDYDRADTDRADPDRADSTDRPDPAPTGDALASEATIEHLLRKTDDAPMADETHGRAPAPARGTTVSTDGDAFAAVLARIAQNTEVPAPVADDDHAPFQSFADVARAGRVKAPATEPAPVEPAPVESAPVASVLPEPVATDPVLPEPVLPEPVLPEPVLPEPVTAESAALPVAVPLPAEPSAVRGRRSGRGDAGPGIDVVRLERLGLSVDRMTDAELAGRDRVAALLDIAHTFPTAPDLPRGGDNVIAVVGDRLGMERAISWIQEMLGLTPDMLMLATRSTSGVFPEQRRITNHEDATDRRREWRRRPQPILVAVDAPVSMSGTAWTRHVLGALEPGAVWGVVDAGRKPEDIVEWSERIGGVDALAVQGLAETTSPAAVVTTGLPVALLDGVPASPARWAALLDERLAA